jgi:hypothetical protein
MAPGDVGQEDEGDDAGEGTKPGEMERRWVGDTGMTVKGDTALLCPVCRNWTANCPVMMDRGTWTPTLAGRPSSGLSLVRNSVGSNTGGSGWADPVWWRRIMCMYPTTFSGHTWLHRIRQKAPWKMLR